MPKQEQCKTCGGDMEEFIDGSGRYCIACGHVIYRGGTGEGLSELPLSLTAKAFQTIANYDGTDEEEEIAAYEALKLLQSRPFRYCAIALRELLAHTRQQEREAIQARLAQRAQQYQRPDGTPGELGLNCWGWRKIAATLRAEADLFNEGSDTDGAPDR